MDRIEWRAKIGLVVVSSAIMPESRYARAAPPGVGFFTSRMLAKPGTGVQRLVEMERHAPQAVEELATAHMDSIAYCCTVSGALRGLNGERAFCLEMEEKWGIPVTSTMLAVVEALQHLGLR